MDIWGMEPRDLERLQGEPVVLSLSGGKDSTACALLLEKHGVNFDRIFFDTGWEHPAIYEYLKGVLEPRFGKIEILKSSKYPGGMVDLVRSKGVFPSRTMRFCTDELKLKPAREYFSGLESPPINVVGIRKGESLARSRALRWEDDRSLGVEVFRPLIDHTFEDVIQMHQEGGIPPNPLYLQGAERVGCFPCIYARKSEVKSVFTMWPERVSQIEKLEEELTENLRSDESKMEAVAEAALVRVAWARALKPMGVTWSAFKQYRRGGFSLTPEQSEALENALETCGPTDADVLEEIDRMSRRTFFHGRTDDGIRRVAEWSLTSRGGRQVALFDETARDGCTRWGMCESPLARSELVKIEEAK